MRDEGVLPVGSVIMLKKTFEFARIAEQMCLSGGNFYYYLIEIEGRTPGSQWALFPYNDDYLIEWIPNIISDN